MSEAPPPSAAPDTASAVHSGSADRFGYEWGRYAELKDIYEEQFRRWTPFMAPEDWRGLSFVDVGCGMGRNSHWPMSYGAAGGRCLASSVAVPVGAGTAERLLDKLVPRVESLKVGPSTDASADFGPVVTAAHMEKIKGYVDLGVAEGAKLLVDGRGFKMQGYENGFYVGGCLFDHVTPEMRIYKEETFGPVLSIVRRDTYEDALEIVNAHEYGNGTAIFTQDGDAARDFAARVEVGMVGINVPIPVPLSYYTFGGWKRSSFGDLNQHGADGFRFWTKTKTVTSRWGSGIRSGADFVIPTMK